MEGFISCESAEAEADRATRSSSLPEAATQPQM
jgi:hypothetical protein